MDEDSDIENIKKESDWDHGQPVTSGMDTNSNKHRRNCSKTVDTEDDNDKSLLDIPFKDQIEIKQEISYECKTPSQEVELVWNKAISEKNNLNSEENQCVTDQNVQFNDNLKEPTCISDVTDEPVIHVICPQNESDVILEGKHNSESTRKTSSAEFQHEFSACVKKFGTQNNLTSHKFGHICGKRFITKVSLEQHRRSCFSQMFQCPDCNKIFQTGCKQARNLLGFECPACGLSVSRHQKTVNVDSKTFHCPVTNHANCTKTFRHKIHLTQDMKWGHIKSEIFPCPEDGCSKTFKAKFNLLQHLKNVHVIEPSYHVKHGTFHCLKNDCRKIFRSEKCLEDHLKNFHVEPRYKCTECNRVFKTRSNLNSHREVHNNIIDVHDIGPSFKCTDCNKVCKTRGTLKDHMTVHKTETPFKCTVNGCEKMFKAKKSRKLHVQLLHSEPQTFHCPENDCSKTFKNKVYLALHMRTVHVKHGIFHCLKNDCNKTFKNKAYLAHHMKTVHVKPGIFHCLKNDCSKIFKTEKGLKDHMKNFHVEPRYKCTDCNKVFKTRGNLNYHMSVHQKQKDLIYRCNVKGCEKMYKTENSRKHHVRKFHSESC